MNNKLLKVIIVGSLPFDLTKIRGGVQSVILNMIEGYNACENIKVNIFSLTKDVTQHKQVTLSETVSIHYYPNGKYKSTKLGSFINGKAHLANLIKEFNPDVIHFQGNGSLLLLSRGLQNQNIIITPHGILHEELKYAEKPIVKINLRIAILLEKIYIKNFRNFIFIADYAKQLFFKKHSFLTNTAINSVTIPNPIEEKFFSEVLFSEKAVNFVYTGSIIPRKGLGIFLEASSKLIQAGHNIKINVIGGFLDPGFEKEIHLIITKLNISENIIFHGWQPKNKVIELLRKSDCFVLPSNQETLPVSIIEAMSMGKIVISSDVGGCPELITNQQTGFLFKKGDADDLFKVMQEVVLNKNLRNISQNAHQKAAESYKSTIVAGKIIDFYYKIANKQNRSI